MVTSSVADTGGGHRIFLSLSPSQLEETRKLQRSRMEAILAPSKEANIIKELEDLREMYEDGILLLDCLVSPLIKLEDVKRGIELLLSALNKHIKLQEYLLSTVTVEECSSVDPVKVLKQEMTEVVQEDKLGNISSSQVPSCEEQKIFQKVGESSQHESYKGVCDNENSEEGLIPDDSLCKDKNNQQDKCDQVDKYLKTIHIKLEQQMGPTIDINGGRKLQNGATDSSFQCEKCNRHFVCRTKFLEHMRRHTGEKPYKCDQCFKGFATKGNLTAHLIVHGNDKAFQCDFCTRKFSRKTDMDRHILTHTGERPFRCEFCFLSFTTNSNLVKHVRTHTGEKPYSCDSCNKKFASKGGLDEHQRIHTGEKPYQCSTCRKFFRKSTHLKTHIRTHTGVKPFQCEVCDKFFTRKANLREHMNTHSRSGDLTI